jgi:hypothetical protein
MNYGKLQDRIKNYIETKYPGALPEGLPVPDAYIDDVIDLDSYKKNCMFFYDFGKYSYEGLSNESDSQSIDFTVYIVVRNGKSVELKKNLLSYAGYFFDFIKNSGGLGGAVDLTEIKNVTFFNNVTGISSIKAAAIELELTSETE